MSSHFEFARIVAAVNAQSGFVGDDHGVGNNAVLSGVALLHVNGKVYPVALHDDEYYSINELYIRDGKARLSRRAVGGVAYGARDLKDSVVEFNDMHSRNENGPMFLTNFHRMRLGTLMPVQLFTKEEVQDLLENSRKVYEAIAAKRSSVA